MCKWKLEHFEDEMTDLDIWCTECKEMFDDNSSFLCSEFKFCPECGQKIEYVVEDK